MMRDNLKNYNNQKITVIARMIKRSKTKDNTECTVLLRDVTADDGQYLTDHVWIKQSRYLKGVKEGNVISFTAVVRRYRKKSGYDYGIDYPKSKALILY